VRRVICARCVGHLALPAHAESLLQQVTGVWTLTSGSEQAVDGTKTVPWSAGNLIIEPVRPHVIPCAWKGSAEA
jgi:hypothetical protein